MPLLVMRDIEKRFQGSQALTKASLEVEPAEIMALIGQNGAGKSTMIKVLTGAYARDGGAIEFDGKPVAFRSPQEAQRNARKLGRVAVVPTLDLPLSDDCHTSPEGNLLLGARKAEAALAIVYGRRAAPQFPDIARAVRAIDGRSIELVFANVPTRLQFIAPGERDFVVEDERGPAAIRDARCVDRDRVRLKLERPVSGRARVHGGYGANPPANLRDAEQNTPVLAFYGQPANDLPMRQVGTNDASPAVVRHAGTLPRCAAMGGNTSGADPAPPSSPGNP